MKKLYQYVVYWTNNKEIRKWKCCESEEKALRLQMILEKQGIVSFIAKDIKQYYGH
jgi:hypothetical protein